MISKGGTHIIDWGSREIKCGTSEVGKMMEKATNQDKVHHAYFRNNYVFKWGEPARDV